MNDRLRTAMMRTGVTVDDLALCCGVDQKTVERWISFGRVPHRTHRWTAARRLGYDDEILANPHAFGEPASANPTLHLRRLDGGQVSEHYIACFERVWDSAKPWHGEEV